MGIEMEIRFKQYICSFRRPFFLSNWIPEMFKRTSLSSTMNLYFESCQNL